MTELEPKLVEAVKTLGFRLLDISVLDEKKVVWEWKVEDLQTGERRTIISDPQHLAITLREEEGIDKFVEYKKQHPKTLELYRLINRVLSELPDQQYTTRQIFYRLVALGVNDPCPNRPKGWKVGDGRRELAPFASTIKRYDKLTAEVTLARERGYVSWHRIIDRGRQVLLFSSWESPEEVLQSALDNYRRDRQTNQPKHIELWAEKKTLQGLLEPLGQMYGIPTLISQGEFSSTCCYESVVERLLHDKHPTLILYVGDYDPTGLMSIEENISKQLRFYSRGKLEFEVCRVAITKAQALKYHLPPAMAKKGDRRTSKFLTTHGEGTWEIEALPPGMLEQLVASAIEKAMDLRVYQEVLDQEKEDVERLTTMIERIDHD